MVISCCAYGCTERYLKEGPITFHRFPKDEIRRKLWEKQLQRENFVSSDSTRICSKHFEDECFENEPCERKRLKPDATPTKFKFPDHLQRNENPRKREIEEGECSTVTVVSANQKKFRYIGDFEEKDMESPTKARKLLALAKSHNEISRKKIQELSRRNRSLIEKVSKLEELISKVEKKALISDSAGSVLKENRPVPEPLPHEVLISIHIVGICGSDVHYWKHGGIGDFTVKEPMILGHESSGTVVKTGNQVKHLKPGDKVCIEPGVPCRRCEFCLNGRYNLCPDIQFSATPPVDGSLCQFYCHDAAFCYKLPDNVSLEEGALMEPLSVAVHACRRSQVTAGKSVLICGAGLIGLVNLLTSKVLGATKVCIIDIFENRLDVAKKLGATYKLNVKDLDSKMAAAKIKSMMGCLPDITIECSGAESSIKLALLVTKSGGVVTCVGLGAPEIKIPIIEASVREVDIRGIFRYANCYPTAIELVSSGAIDVKPLITHHFNLENMLKAFETAASVAAIKVLIHCSE